MKLNKCHFYAKEIQYFGHILSTTAKKSPSKTTAVKLIQPMKNAKQVKAFLGLVGYYHTFIKNFAEMAKPLRALNCHDAKLDRKSGHHAAFNTIKRTLIEAPILHYPDPSECYIVYTDACGA